MPSDNVTDALDNLTIAVGNSALLGVFALIAIVLTVAMFLTRERMLGFPCAIFWALLGGYGFTQSTATWDIYYFLGFSSIAGGAVFCVLAQFALREKRDAIGDTEMEHGDGEFIGEKSTEPAEPEKEASTVEEAGETETGYTPGSFAERRRRTTRKKKINWGVFK